MYNHGIHQMDMTSAQLILGFPFVLALFVYLAAVVSCERNRKPWPKNHLILWIFGSLSALAAVIGPLAERAHADFMVHMAVHLLLGMLAPLFMVLAAPMTLLFRTLKTLPARRVAAVLNKRYFRLISDPIAASLLNVGGLWVLYTTSLFSLMHKHILLYAVIHIHVFLAGYLFTAALICIDPVAHRKSFIFRAIVMVLAFAGHGILSKYIYAYPPDGVPAAQAEAGGMLMYYGGDIIDLIMIIIFCHQWYKAARLPIPKQKLAAKSP